MSIVTIQDVKISTVQNGKTSYSVAEAVYTDSRGENKNKKVMSFSNPAVFAFLSKIKSPTRVSVENGGAPYYNWTKIDAAGEEEVPAAKASPSAPGSKTWADSRETPEERARRQLMIVKQSSLSNAIAYYQHETLKTANVTEDDVMMVAQKFVDWVMSTGLEAESAQEA